MFSVSCVLFVGLGVFFVIQPLSFLVFQETYVETSYLCSVNFIKIGMSYNLLKGKKGIIFGALNEQSIAWKVRLQKKLLKRVQPLRCLTLL